MLIPCGRREGRRREGRRGEGKRSEGGERRRTSRRRGEQRGERTEDRGQGGEGEEDREGIGVKVEMQKLSHFCKLCCDKTSTTQEKWRETDLALLLILPSLTLKGMVTTPYAPGTPYRQQMKSER